MKNIQTDISRNIMSKNKFTTKRITTIAILISLSALVSFITKTDFAIAGAPVLRLSLAGPFSKYIAILFGPLYGGISSGLLDIINFILKPSGAYILPLTIVAICKGASIGFLWLKVKNINAKLLNKVFLWTFILIGLVGTINLFTVTFFPNSLFNDFILSVGKRSVYITYGLIFVGALGVILHLIMYLIAKKTSSIFNENYLKLIIVVGIPSLFFTIINTYILMVFLDIQNTFLLFLVPRVVEEFVTIMYNVYILSIFMNLKIKI